MLFDISSLLPPNINRQCRETFNSFNLIWVAAPLLGNMALTRSRHCTLARTLVHDIVYYTGNCPPLNRDHTLLPDMA